MVFYLPDAFEAVQRCDQFRIGRQPCVIAPEHRRHFVEGDGQLAKFISPVQRNWPECPLHDILSSFFQHSYRPGDGPCQNNPKRNGKESKKDVDQTDEEPQITTHRACPLDGLRLSRQVTLKNISRKCPGV